MEVTRLVRLRLHDSWHVGQCVTAPGYEGRRYAYEDLVSSADPERYGRDAVSSHAAGYARRCYGAQAGCLQVDALGDVSRIGDPARDGKASYEDVALIVGPYSRVGPQHVDRPGYQVPRQVQVRIVEVRRYHLTGIGPPEIREHRNVGRCTLPIRREPAAGAVDHSQPRAGMRQEVHGRGHGENRGT